MTSLNEDSAKNRAKRRSPTAPSGRVRSIAARGPPAEQHFAIVAIGASAGGLEACTKLIAALPAKTGMAFILIQHLEPTHASLMVDLLAEHTAMTVMEATDGLPLEPEHLFIIPPGKLLAVAGGVLRISKPLEKRGARLPFDFLLASLAHDCGPRTACVVLSGTGSDGSVGLRALKHAGGLVIAQDPEDAEYDGMPRSAVATGAVDIVAPIPAMSEALATFAQKVAALPKPKPDASQADEKGGLAEIVEVLRSATPHDFRHYKPGTLQRRIDRRIDVAGLADDDTAGYLAKLRSDPAECEALAQDLLINVTSFFRDPQAFALLGSKIIPDLLNDRAGEKALRVWVAGCSSGEETYSIAMLVLEAIAQTKRPIKLQMFASDVDPDAVAAARDGFYPDAIEADVSAERLERFFVKEDGGYRVTSELRATIVFTVQDVLTDPPFSRVDLVSCRNLLIYLNPDAQARVIALFHFALRKDGILFLGSSETPGDIDGRFELIAKPERLYRRIGRNQPGALAFALGSVGGAAGQTTPARGSGPSRQAALAELCRRSVMETHAPAAVLVNRKGECLYLLGPTDRYLRVASGFPTHDLLAMATPALRVKLALALRQIDKATPRLSIGRNRIGKTTFVVDAQLVISEGEELVLICFVDQPTVQRSREPNEAPVEGVRVTELEGELEAAREELQIAHQSIAASADEQKAINEEALSVSEEYQSTNEELLTSKEELQSLNEELSALNSQLQETLERQRIASDDLQNVLDSTDVATLFLDTELKIRFFTPATRTLFNVIPGDIGRPLADLHPLAGDHDLTADARGVLKGHASTEREIEAPGGRWFVRRILPYRVHGIGVEGIVVTFTDITDRKRAAGALESAMRRAELANVAKSRFLAAASHDLRQPLQSLTLLQALLEKTVTGEKAPQLVVRLGQTVAAMSSMLNALLDINQIEAGVVQARPMPFAMDDLLGRLRDEFGYQAAAQRLSLRIVPCSLMVMSDPTLLEQMVRNLISNALKYTRQGKVLIGCRRRTGVLRIEIWDTGIGIAEGELKAIFDEFHQIGNDARERSQGLGLGLSIVQRLGELLGHPVQVRSISGKGSVFSIEVPYADRSGMPEIARIDAKGLKAGGARVGKIIVIDDDPELGQLVDLMLREQGHSVKTALDGEAALRLVAAGAIRPDIILADYNLPGGMNGLAVLAALRQMLHHPVPGIILTGDISTAACAEIAAHDCTALNKPVNANELLKAIDRLLTASSPPAAPIAQSKQVAESLIFVVDDDLEVRNSIRQVLEADGCIVKDFADAEAFLAAYEQTAESCLLIDSGLPGMSGLALLKQLRAADDPLPTILITGASDVSIAVAAMQAGASDFIEKPVSREALISSIRRALRQSHAIGLELETHESAVKHLAGLTVRQHAVMDLVLAGHPSKNIAADLGISQRTVENHRASIMRKTGAKSLPELARLAVAAGVLGSSSA